ncbi:dTDP-4-dehydrorhamnose 3,5-epimerase [Campylobacter sp. US33a]|nr:dTDP-4-dehydrorhamnose 3,5-epimerase [Campylobacter sp. US33a]
MQILDTNFKEVKLLKKRIFSDNRGYFVENFHQQKIEEFLSKKISFCQENESCSKKHTLRGLHYQMHPFSQTKLINIISGGIMDIIVDLRRNSPTFLKHIKIIMYANDNLQLFIPRGFAHGFIALEDFTKISYMVDNFYNPQSERGILYNDPLLGIDWEVEDKDIILSEKDSCLPRIKDIEDFFDYSVDYYE